MDCLPPTPEEIKKTRKDAGLSQSDAAKLICSKLRTWQDWESGKAKMHAGLWKFFIIEINSCNL